MSNSENDKLISIVIPCYNVADYVGRALESCMSQTYTNLDIVVIDDGSKDNTADVVKKYMEKDTRISMFHKENGGLATARNAGLDHMKGDYVIFLDADDWLEPDTVEYYLTLMADTEKDYLIAAGMYGIVVDDNGVEHRREYTSGAQESILSAQEAMGVLTKGTMNLQSSCYKLYSVRIIKENNLRFEDSFSHAEDGLFVFQYLKVIPGVHYSPRPTWNRLYRAGSLSQIMYTHGKICNILAAERMYNSEGNSPELNKLLLHFLAMRFEAVMTVALECGAYKYKKDIKEMRTIMKPYVPVYLKGDYGFKNKLFLRIYEYFPLWIAKLAELYTTKKNGKEKLNSDIAVQ